jgi:bacillopeptidase F
MDRLRERHGCRTVASLLVAPLALAAALVTPGVARGAIVGSAVASELATSPAARVPVVITLADQVDEDRYAGQPAALVRALRERAAATQPSVADDLDGSVRRFWLVNAIGASIDRVELEELAADPAVARIDRDVPVEVTGEASAGSSQSWGIGAIHAPSAWSRFGVNGSGVRIGSIDTGVDATNPELAGAVVAWRDIVHGRPTPYDDNGHGSHTIGTMVARNVTGGAVGVAPGAQVVVAKAIRADGTASGADLLAAGQWMTDPDGDPATADFPAVINNSWTTTDATNPWFRPMVQRWVALGITPVFGAGNSPETIGNPASYPEVIAVGASEASGALWPNTSRGTVTWEVGGAATTVTKPDLSAPGADITSTVGPGYALYSGTSMAAPHVAGTVALMKQARPDLTPDAVRHILTRTATDHGPAGPDRDFGAGVVNADAAVAATGLAATGPAAPTAHPKAQPARRVAIRELRVTRRGQRYIVTGRLTGPGRIRGELRRERRVSTTRDVRGRTVALRTSGGRFRLTLGTRGLPAGRYTLVVLASDRAGHRLDVARRGLRLRG